MLIKANLMILISLIVLHKSHDSAQAVELQDVFEEVYVNHFSCSVISNLNKVMWLHLKKRLFSGGGGIVVEATTVRMDSTRAKLQTCRRGHRSVDAQLKFADLKVFRSCGNYAKFVIAVYLWQSRLSSFNSHLSWYLWCFYMSFLCLYSSEKRSCWILCSVLVGYGAALPVASCYCCALLSTHFKQTEQRESVQPWTAWTVVIKASSIWRSSLVVCTCALGEREVKYNCRAHELGIAVNVQLCLCAAWKLHLLFLLLLF